MKVTISSELRDLVVNMLGHTAGLSLGEGGRLRPVLPLESARVLLELQQAKPVEEGDADHAAA